MSMPAIATAIVVAPKAQKTLAKSTTPPPRKSEIIEALALRKLRQLAKEVQDRRNRIAELTDLISKATCRIAEEKLAGKQAASMIIRPTHSNVGPFIREEWDGDKTTKVWRPAVVALSNVTIAIEDYPHRRAQADRGTSGPQGRGEP